MFRQTWETTSLLYQRYVLLRYQCYYQPYNDQLVQCKENSLSEITLFLSQVVWSGHSTVCGVQFVRPRYNRARWRLTWRKKCRIYVTRKSSIICYVMVVDVGMFAQQWLHNNLQKTYTFRCIRFFIHDLTFVAAANLTTTGQYINFLKKFTAIDHWAQTTERVNKDGYQIYIWRYEKHTRCRVMQRARGESGTGRITRRVATESEAYRRECRTISTRRQFLCVVIGALRTADTLLLLNIIDTLQYKFNKRLRVVSAFADRRTTHVEREWAIFSSRRRGPRVTDSEIASSTRRQRNKDGQTP